MYIRAHLSHLPLQLLCAGMLAILLASTPLFSLVKHAPASNSGLNLKTAVAWENAQQGTLKWAITPHYGSTIQIQAYASSPSVQPGQSLTFYVSTLRTGTHYLIDIYRLGWYSGLGGRLMRVITGLTGLAQGYYDGLNHRLVDCLRCHIDRGTGLIEANWLPSYTLKIPGDWTSGIYVAKFIDSASLQTYATFVVKSNRPSTYVAVTSELTFQAYNAWGGYSLYANDQPKYQRLEKPILPRAVKVSFDRPYLENDGAGQVLTFEVNAVRWLESRGYDLSYISNVDLHEHPEQLLTHRAYLDLGHDEYWTREMRDGLETARNAGVGLAFLSANTGYWQIRLEPDSQRQRDRTVVCYRVSSRRHTLNLDPFYGKDNTRLTSQWRDPILHRPENALVGVMYSGLTHLREGFSWRLDPHVRSSLLNGTNLVPGRTYGCGLVGYEWDRVVNNGFSPPGLQVLSTSPTLNNDNKPDVSNSTYYIAPSGALVFAAGSMYLTHAIDAYRDLPDPHCAVRNALVPGIQQLLSNVMAALIIRDLPISPSKGSTEDMALLARHAQTIS